MKVKDLIIDQQNEFIDTDYGYQEEVKPMEETKSQTNGLPEAPASATVKIKSPNGFEYLFTMRDEKASNLLYKMQAMEKHLIEKGYTALAQNAYGKPQVPTKPCPKHNVPMKEKTSKTGEKFYSHSQGVYPNLDYCNGQGFRNEMNHQMTPSGSNMNEMDV